MIAVVGLACELPDASSPDRLWENVLAQRRAFRRLPPERLRLDDYWSADRGAEDRMYATEAALLEGYEFDRVRFRVPGAAFRASDLTHWLALDVACRALADAGLGELPRERTGVMLGNTLTGEMSRSGLLRLRWPYVRRVVAQALSDEPLDEARRAALLKRIEASYKAPFAPIGDESLAGALSNTIAGRICNHLDLGGGGYTVDGACAASLLAVITACERLLTDDLDVALAGGVDISLDPFELVGFAKAGALAEREMRVYDVRSQGFWPGEGCGFVVLMRLEDARAAGARIHAVLRGWGISSDGSGGLTRPELSGQLRALRRAYARAGVGIESVGYFEGHGTGTPVGDATELRALMTACAERGSEDSAVIGSVKANVGHTKAAAGVAGLIKATLAVREAILPPTTGCADPHPLLSETEQLRVSDTAAPWRGGERTAGISAMGFGGINSHVVLSAGPDAAKRDTLGERERLLVRSAQDAELFLFAADAPAALERALERAARAAGGRSRAELGDLAVALGHPAPAGRLRAAIVASSAPELVERLEAATALLPTGAASAPGVFLDAARRQPRIGLLFPGQGAPARSGGGALGRRVPATAALFAFDLPTGRTDTAFAQPAIVRGSLAAVRALDELGIEAAVAVGHSLGEITALAWAGVVSEDAALRIAAGRGRAMSEHAEPGGAMAAVALDPAGTEALAEALPVVVAGINGPASTTVAGSADAVDALVRRAAARGVSASRLHVSHAFHSPAMLPAVGAVARVLAAETFAAPRRRVLSTVTGVELTARDDVPALLLEQLTAPVRFADALSTAAAGLDLLIEAGPGHGLAALAAKVAPVPAVSLDVGGPSLMGLLEAAGAAWALGAPLRAKALFGDRFARPLDVGRPPRLIANPCEQAPEVEPEVVEAPVTAPADPQVEAAAPADRLGLVRELLAARAELPLEMVAAESRALDDLHLNSIVVAEVAAEAARRLGLAPPPAPSALANATAADLAAALGDGAGGAADGEAEPAGAGPWTRAFTIALEPRARRGRTRPAAPRGRWTLIGEPDDASAQALRAALQAQAGGGVALALPEGMDERHLPLFESVVRALPAERLLVLQHGGGGGGFARSLHLEMPALACCVVDGPPGEQVAQRAADEAAAHTEGFLEVHYDAAGTRSEPVLRRLDLSTPPLRLGADDVLLVTGGAQGIAVECALALTRGTQAALLIVGRRDPTSDAALRAALDRLAATGVRARYLRADVADADGAAAAVAEARRAFGPVTALLHGAGRNVPMPAAELTEAELRATLAPKVGALRHLLAAHTEPPRLVVALGSLIARSGMRGDAHYALANEWQTTLLERYAAAHPECTCLAFESSVWLGVGMGERLRSVDALAREGVAAIPPDVGADLLARVAASGARPVAVVAAGRVGDYPTLRRERAELPLRRFLERPRVHQPGIELVADAELSSDLDPYLDDHRLDGTPLVPAVLGMEAMAQAVMALTGATAPPVFEDIRFERPLLVPDGARAVVRVAALADGPRTGRVVIRSDQTGFAVDHVSACWRAATDPGVAPAPVRADGRIALDADELYRDLLFQRGRFRRLRGYRRLSANECHADVEARASENWFGRFLPAELVLGDPGARDATLHALQACLPHVRVVPVAAGRVAILRPHAAPGIRHVRARERASDSLEYTYDITVQDAEGELLERWDSLRLRVVAPVELPASWPAPLLAVYLQRRLAALDASLRVAAVNGGRRARADAAIGAALGVGTDVVRRSDGRPEVPSGVPVSAAHAEGLTLAVAGAGPVACDIEPVVPRPRDTWGDLLGTDRLRLSEAIAADRDEDTSSAATRVWAAGECLRKRGVPTAAPLTLSHAAEDGWLVLASGSHQVATFVAQVRGVASPLAVAVLAGDGRARL